MIITVTLNKTQINFDTSRLDQDIEKLTDNELNDVQEILGALDRRLVYKCFLRDLDANWFDMETIKAAWPDVRVE